MEILHTLVAVVAVQERERVAVPVVVAAPRTRRAVSAPRVATVERRAHPALAALQA